MNDIVENALYAEIDRLTQRVKELEAERDADRRRDYGYSQQTVDALTAERDKLEAENKRLREVAELLLPIAELYTSHLPYCELPGSGMSIYRERVAQAREAMKEASHEG